VELGALLSGVPPEDIVMATRIDRIARSTFGLLSTVKRIVGAKASST
jgi:DNA invertase Pin-like site-specific DNA recombinase